MEYPSSSSFVEPSSGSISGIASLRVVFGSEGAPRGVSTRTPAMLTSLEERRNMYVDRRCMEVSLSRA